MKQASWLQYLDLIKRTIEKSWEWINKQPRERRLLVYSGIGCLVCVSTIFLHNIGSHLYRKYGKKYAMPPGMIGIPYFGSLFTAMIMYNQEYFNHNILPSYGPLTLFKMGQSYSLVINDCNLYKCFMSSKYCIDRPPLFTCNVYEGLAFKNKLWYTRRKMATVMINEMARKNELEKNLMQLLNQHIYPVINDKITNNNGLWSCRKDLRNFGFNFVFRGLLGCNYILDKKNKDYIGISTLIEKLDEKLILNFFFSFFYLPFNFKFKLGAQKEMNQVNGIFEKYFKNASKTSNVWVKAKKEFGKIDESILVTDVMGKCFEGEGTVATSMFELMMNLVKYEQLQEEIYQEIFKFSDKNGNIEYDNCIKCIKLCAFINETLRIFVQFQRGMARTLTHDCVCKFDINSETGECENIVLNKINYNSNNNDDENDDSKCEFSYFISKDFSIEGNVSYMSTLKKDIFNIYNWIDKRNSDNSLDWKLIHNNNSNNSKMEMFTFGVGKRRCPGEMVAINCLRYIFASLILNYKFEAKKKPYNPKRAIDFMMVMIESETDLIVTRRQMT